MLNIGDKTYRNLQEQVAENAKQIAQLIEFVDGIDVEDHLIALTSGTGTLTPEQFKVAEQETAYITLNGNVYIKSYSNASDIDFYIPNISWASIGGGGIRITKSGIRIRKSNGNYGTFVNTYDTYEKSEIDSLLSLYATVSYVDAQLATKASLSGATFTGSIKAPEVLELMSGYGFDNSTLSSGITPVYIGAVKTGNKLTLVWCVSFAKTASTPNNIRFGRITVPVSISQKIAVLPDDQYNRCALITCPIFDQDDYSTPSATKYSAIEVSQNGGWLQAGINQVQDLTNDKTYYIRVEVTFLLSDSLA